MHYAVFLPILQKYGFESNIAGNYLWLLILGTVLIAAGGYVLNDYFDIKIDRINRPDKVIVSNIVSKQSAMLMHQILTFSGAFIGLLLAWIFKSFTLAFIFIVIPGLLWFYSASYKRQFMIGNIAVAFVAGMSVLIVAIFGVALLKKEYGGLIFETPIPSEVQSWIGGFALFAFLTTWIREIIKDVEDEHGDREMECRTMPVVWGIPRTKIFIYILTGIVITLLLVTNFTLIHFEGQLTLKYTIFGILIPLLVLVYLIVKARLPMEFHQAATLCKFIMLTGVLYSFVFYFLIAQTYGFPLFNLFIIK